jgi:hypothetical protein
MTPEFRQELDSYIGKPSGRPAAVAPDRVNLPMIRHWVDALGDSNPAYTDQEGARRSRFGAIVAPPGMLQTWTMQRPKISGIAERGGMPSEPSSGRTAFSVLDDAGFVGIVATRTEIEIERYVQLGELLTSVTVIDEISDEKKTALGPGHFCTWETTYRVESGEVVGRERFTVLKFNPKAKSKK